MNIRINILTSGFLLFFLLGVSPPVVSAQNKQDKPSLALRFFSFGDVLDGWNFSTPESAAFKPLPSIPNGSRSVPVKVPAVSEIHLFSKGIKPTAEVPAPPPTASAKIPAGCKSVLVLIFPVPNSTLPKFVAAAFPDDAADFPIGAYKFLNATGRSISGTLGDSTFSVEPAKTVVVKPSPPKGGLQLILFDSRFPGKPLLRRGWLYRPDFRTIAFIREVGEPVPVLMLDSMPQSEASMNESPDSAESAGSVGVQTIQER
jgi:hypothetical protein